MTKTQKRIKQLEEEIQLKFLQWIVEVGRAIKKMSKHATANFFLGVWISEYFQEGAEMNTLKIIFGILLAAYFFYMCGVALMKIGDYMEKQANDINKWRRKKSSGKDETAKKILNWLLGEEENDKKKEQVR